MASTKSLFSVNIDRRKADAKLKAIRDAQGKFAPSTSLTIEQLGPIFVNMLKLVTPKATGRLADSTTYNLTRAHGRYRLTLQQTANSITGIPISLLRGYGRGPGFPPPIGIIHQWMIAAGVKPKINQSRKNAARAIAISIGVKGTSQFYLREEPYWNIPLYQMSLIADNVATQIGANLRIIFGSGLEAPNRDVRAIGFEEGQIEEY